ncbi:MAG: DUF2306 domain-containing protein [Planctomicrobium sp.]|jgi:hypothetical protein|nr:DUF2306 domain-containing protein [Planctomicrobium sp.]
MADTSKAQSRWKIKSSYLVTLKSSVGLLIVVVTGKILAEYVNYFPANFAADFLQGRKNHFYGIYQWAFYSHILAGPVTLIVGLILVNDRFRLRWSRWHKRFGKLQIVTVLLVLTPSGLWMSFYALSGIGVKLGFASLALVTGYCAWKGWRHAVQRDFRRHRIWMLRCYVLLCSAVVTRILGGTFVVLGIGADWTYYLAAWGSWLVPLLIFEVGRRRKSTGERGA